MCLPFCSSCVSAGGGKQRAAGINTAANDRLILFSSDLYLSIIFFLTTLVAVIWFLNGMINKTCEMWEL